MENRILYYSTNRNLDNMDGIVPFRGKVAFREALLQGQAPDEGLYMPDRLPRISYEDIISLKDKPYAEAAILVTRTFLSDEIDAGILRKNY